MEYATAEWRDKFRLASENPVKDDLIELLLDRHDGPDDRDPSIIRGPEHPGENYATASRRISLGAQGVAATPSNTRS